MAKAVTVFGGGCFWCLEAVFQRLKGVLSVTSGYAGGQPDRPTYEQVCSHTTGHAETVQIEFDSTKTSYTELLDIFFDKHDPTQLDRQGPDVGDSYRSVIFYHNANQKKLAEHKIAELTKSKKYSDPIVTQLVAASTFWRAEEYHQQYLRKRNLGAC